MDSLDSANSCPQCGAPQAGRAPDGLCPSCLLAGVAVSTEPGDATVPLGAVPPAIPYLGTIAAAFPHLEILEFIGQGGMGCVFKARQPQLNRVVALKILPESLGRDPAFAERFTREAQALAALNHPNIVTIHDFGQSGGFYFLLMEYVDGVNLRQLLRARKLSPEEALAVVPPLCDALQFAHDRGIVHRDIKPENLLLDRAGRIKIADFGIARMLRVPGGASTPSAPSAAPKSPEGAGVASSAPTIPAGTPGYMAPEQKSAPSTVDSRADIYSLGVVVYELLTGELPGAPLLPPSQKVQIDVRLDAIVLRALAQTPELRYSTAAEFRTRLETLASSSPPLIAPHPESAAGGRRLMACMATLTTPEELETVAGQFFHYRTRGHLILDERQLAFSRDDTHLVIPLRAIRDVSIARQPRSMSPVRRNLLSITIEQDGKSRRYLIGPMKGLIELPASWNARVADWHRALRDAVEAATGRVPASTPADQLAVPLSPGGLIAFMVIPLAIGAGLIATLATRRDGSLTISPGPLFLVVGIFALTWLVPIAWSALRAPHRVSRRQWVLTALIAVVIVVAGVLFIARYQQSLQPVLDQLSWQPVERLGNVILVDVRTRVRGSAVELRAGLTGPALTSWAGEWPHPSEPVPARGVTLVRAGEPSGNHPWALRATGVGVWRLGFVFPHEAAAVETYRDLQGMDLGAVPLDQEGGWELFHTIASDGQAYRASILAGRPTTSAHPAWVSVSGQIARSEDHVQWSWSVTAARAGRMRLLRGPQQTLASLSPQQGTRLHEGTVRLEVQRLGTNQVRITCGFSATRAAEDLPIDFTTLVAELDRTALFSAKAVRGQPILLARLGDEPMLVEVVDDGGP